ncbi:MAG: ACT domain-containing protein, partial [Halobacteriales archaeon]|nr:ACT domain-containing protein [Halobacteriales archaeon]
GRYLKIRTVLKDRPGALVDLSTILADLNANIYAFHHDRTSRDVAMNDAEIEIELETRGPDHVDTLLSHLRSAGYEVDVLQ